MAVRRSLIRRIAIEQLSQNKVVKAPVPVARIAKSLGLRILKTDGDDEISGFLLQDHSAGRCAIGVNKDHASTRQRFTIAHEIGHFLLHDADTVHVDRGYTARFRNEKSSEGTDVAEQEANLFAAELLMPAEFLENALASLSSVDVEDESLIKQLAEEYRVSRLAMTIRFSNLGFINM